MATLTRLLEPQRAEFVTIFYFPERLKLKGVSTITIKSSIFGVPIQSVASDIPLAMLDERSTETSDLMKVDILSPRESFID